MSAQPPRKNNSQGMVEMFQNSVGTSRKKSLSLHPQLYSGLYNRASEIKALNKIVRDLRLASDNLQKQDYHILPPILHAIKDTLNGKPNLSWWNLFTLSLGQALSAENEEQKNQEEIHCLTTISQILTDIIRNYRSDDSKLLLQIRLAALDIDSRLVELVQFPQDIGNTDETSTYLASEFKLLNQAIDKLKGLPKAEWQHNPDTLLECLSKSNRLLKVLYNVKESNPQIYEQFSKLTHVSQLQKGIVFLLHNSDVLAQSTSIHEWQKSHIDEFLEIFELMPESILAVQPGKLYNLLHQIERLFIKDANTRKLQPAIFSSARLKEYLVYFNDEFIKQNAHLRSVIKGVKEDREIKQNLIFHIKQRMVEENDLHHLSSMVRFESYEFQDNPRYKLPSHLQQEILNRMIMVANLSQPKELDHILKSFSEEDKENRYFLTQEVILEQFIRWRKQGIY